ncbi:MAG: hypothetical protein RIR80_869, partial [Bacteroidota bacterium]
MPFFYAFLRTMKNNFNIRCYN